MIVKLEPKLVRHFASAAKPGMVYLWENFLIMCFIPCYNHHVFYLEEVGKRGVHFIRLNPSDPSSLILNETDLITYVGEPTITVVEK